MNHCTMSPAVRARQNGHPSRLARVMALLLIALLAGPVNAHSLRLFARVDGAQVSGYAFFIGGGRPSNVGWVAKMDGVAVAEGHTDDEGHYQFTVPSRVTGDVVITVDTQEGHVATTRLPPTRFADLSGADAPQGGASGGTARGPDASQGAAPLPGDARAGMRAPLDAADRQLVEEAVERQVGPLLERIEAMDARMRLTDTMSGIFLIIGLAGIGLWARSRKR
ncbi:hypothetical protein [Castellaniella sp.]|uniref:hypothetical protein n=1 Tax=Castellaniella sp. TaxID=1955812 RepID=UPI00355CF882